MRLTLIGLCALALSAGAEPEITLDLQGEYELKRGDGFQKIDLKLDREHASLTWTRADGRKTEYALDVLANHPGPAGRSTHLAWLVARSRDDFWILWTYLNASSTRGCWINFYHFSENTAPMRWFNGSYVYRPPAEFTTAPFEIDIPLERAGAYKGPAFRHRDFGPTGGTFSRLRWIERGAAIDVKLPSDGSGEIVRWMVKEGESVKKGQALLEARVGDATATVASPADGRAIRLHTTAVRVASGASVAVLEPTGVAKDLEEKLSLKPLIHLEVPPANGWDVNGWTEIHLLARSDDGTRLFYVVTYTAVDHGWAVDLKDGRVLKTLFGKPVELEKR